MSRGVFALVLALLVPARAAALCCLGGQEGPVAESHRGAHHSEVPLTEGGSGLVLSDAAPGCPLPGVSAPALHERGFSDDARTPIVAPTFLSSPGFVVAARSRRAPHPRAASPFPLTIPLPLRL